MNPWLWQLRLAACACLGFATSSPAWAQAPVSADKAPPPVVIVPGSAAPPAVVTEQATEIPAPEQRRPFHRLAAIWPFQQLHETQPVRTAVHEQLHNHGLGCYATISTVGCTSLGSELTFIFGSCRAFFGESCAPGGGLTHGGCGANGCP